MLQLLSNQAMCCIHILFILLLCLSENACGVDCLPGWSIFSEIADEMQLYNQNFQRLFGASGEIKLCLSVGEQKFCLTMND